MLHDGQFRGWLNCFTEPLDGKLDQVAGKASCASRSRNGAAGTRKKKSGFHFSLNVLDLQNVSHGVSSKRGTVSFSKSWLYRRRVIKAFPPGLIRGPGRYLSSDLPGDLVC